MARFSSWKILSSLIQRAGRVFCKFSLGAYADSVAMGAILNSLFRCIAGEHKQGSPRAITVPRMWEGYLYSTVGVPFPVVPDGERSVSFGTISKASPSHLSCLIRSSTKTAYHSLVRCFSLVCEIEIQPSRMTMMIQSTCCSHCVSIFNPRG